MEKKRQKNEESSINEFWEASIAARYETSTNENKKHKQNQGQKV